MAFTRLAGIIAIALASSHSAYAATTGAKPVTCSTGQVTANAACCALFPVVSLMQSQLFDNGECGEGAHSALRLSFHDAIGFSIHGGKGGGADGSILQFGDVETQFHANGGIDEIVDDQTPVWQQTNLTAGDFLHLAAAVGTANCPGAPRLQFMLGRPAPVAPAPDLTIPEPTDSVTSILARFADAGFSPREAVALLTSHTIAAADVVDPAIPRTPFDSTSATFDSQIFLEVLLKGRLFPGPNNSSQPGEVLSPLAGEMRLQSDFVISQDSRTACFWQQMINNQQLMISQFKAAMAKLQLLGQNTAHLIDCSDVVPIPRSFTQAIKYPASFSQADVQIACPQLPFPSLATVAGPAPTVAPV
ncbi:Versatile peroxidase VPS1 [Psilocybe cubensis]|uniref:Peroxidase n=2 Tax=Psilocybe cubensis TaxID=181762 RepID=A0A8H8CFW1_PSICU|nr:Versatile peroxidase VPS1 [Psilocybe cubensis]KAH9477133.1 Versatile peroxidase VPS1 [Psilocybe cubensis]